MLVHRQKHRCRLSTGQPARHRPARRLLSQAELARPGAPRRQRGVHGGAPVPQQGAGLALGYRSVIFNLVFAENQVARRLWRKLGFSELAVLPGAVLKNDRTYRDAIIMWKSLLP